MGADKNVNRGIIAVNALILGYFAVVERQETKIAHVEEILQKIYSKWKYVLVRKLKTRVF